MGSGRSTTAGRATRSRYPTTPEVRAGPLHQPRRGHLRREGWTAPWYIQPSFPVLYRKDVLARAGVAVPTTWSALLKSMRGPEREGNHADRRRHQGRVVRRMAVLDHRRAGITSISDVLDATTGKAKFTDPTLAAWWTRVQRRPRDNVLERRHRLARPRPGPAALGRRQERDDGGGRRRTSRTSSRSVSQVGATAMSKAWAVRRQARLDLADGRHHRLDEVPRGGGRLHHVHAHPGAAGSVVQDDRGVPGRQSVQHEPDHPAAAEGAVRPREEGLSIPGELHPAGARFEGLLRTVPARARRQHDGPEGGRGDREGRAADPADAAEDDGELQDMVCLVPVEA